MNESARPSSPAYWPLYRQVREQLVQRLSAGLWPPGSALPSETELAGELGVSQGTVRKALDELAAENVVVRRQGRGTFVARHGEGGFLFQFFKLIPDHDQRIFPQSRVLSVAREPATVPARDKLNLPAAAEVVHLTRLRWLDAAPCVLEHIFVPAAMFPAIETGEIPNNLYALYSAQFSVTIGGGHEKLKAVALLQADANLLATPANTPALQIERVALSIDNVPVEWRISLCLTEAMHYFADLK